MLIRLDAFTVSECSTSIYGCVYVVIHSMKTQAWSLPYSCDRGWMCLALKKSFFVQEEIEYLEYLLPKRQGIKPQPSKVDVIMLGMQPPKIWR